MQVFDTLREDFAVSNSIAVGNSLRENYDGPREPDRTQQGWSSIL